ncbi:MAG: helix-turn-helix transcriptional regulator [Clostridia bacterium]|nr:helix-turn-helix transcriptional regulator [Clostridia bacterium]
MENVSIINETIAKNLIYYRKAAGLTQAELAEKINYSDKSVSKWESGNGVPDIYTLMQLADLYGVTVNAFVGEDTPVQHKKKVRGLHLLIMLLSSGIVWLVASCIFVMLQLLQPGRAWWLGFLYAVVANAVVLLVYGVLWKHRILNFISISTIIWVSLLSVYLTVRIITGRLGIETTGLWCIFLIGVPLQVLEVLWAFFRSLLRKQRNINRKKDEEKQD